MNSTPASWPRSKRGGCEEVQRLLRAHIEQSRIEVRKITLEMLFQARNRSRTRR